jgi:hypothetical protein
MLQSLNPASPDLCVRNGPPVGLQLDKAEAHYRQQNEQFRPQAVNLTAIPTSREPACPMVYEPEGQSSRATQLGHRLRFSPPSNPRNQSNQPEHDR